MERTRSTVMTNEHDSADAVGEAAMQARSLALMNSVHQASPAWVVSKRLHPCLVTVGQERDVT